MASTNSVSIDTTLRVFRFDTSVDFLVDEITDPLIGLTQTYTLPYTGGAVSYTHLTLPTKRIV